MSDNIIRWWPKSGCTMSIESMDEAHTSLRRELDEEARRHLEQTAELVQLAEQRRVELADAQQDAERYRWIHDNVDWVDGVGFVLTLHPDADCCAMFQWAIDTAMAETKEES
jgi:predicted RNase H-related nuclease YkuK (DUF458 family)